MFLGSVGLPQLLFFCQKRPNLICWFHFTKRCLSISILFIIRCSLSLSLFSLSLFLSFSLSLFLSFSLSLFLSFSLSLLFSFSLSLFLYLIFISLSLSLYLSFSLSFSLQMRDVGTFRRIAYYNYLLIYYFLGNLHFFKEQERKRFFNISKVYSPVLISEKDHLFEMKNALISFHLLFYVQFTISIVFIFMLLF